MKNFLVIDDSKFAREYTCKLLESLEYEVIGVAVDGLDGIQKVKELNPDFVITDIEMPKLDGISMIKEIRNNDESIKIIVVSSVVNSQLLHEALKLRASVIKKPLKETKLLNAIKLLSR